MDHFLQGLSQQLGNDMQVFKTDAPYGWPHAAAQPSASSTQQSTGVPQQFLGAAYRQVNSAQRAFPSPASPFHTQQDFYAQLAFNAQPSFSTPDTTYSPPPMMSHPSAVDQLPDFALNEDLGSIALQQQQQQPQPQQHQHQHQHQQSPQPFGQLPVYATQQPYSQRQVPRSRFSREEQEFLEAEYQKDHKPTTAVKRSLALRLGVETPRINNWFQNRRAREKKDAIVQNYQARLQRETEEAERDRALLASTAPFPDQSLAGSMGTRQGSPIDSSAEELSPSESYGDASQASSSPLSSPPVLPISHSHGLDYIGLDSPPYMRTSDEDDGPTKQQLRARARRDYRYNPLAAVPRAVPLITSHSFEGISSMHMLETSMSVPMSRRLTVPGYGKMDLMTEGLKLDGQWLGEDGYVPM